MKWAFLISLSLLFWGLIGLARLLTEIRSSREPKPILDAREYAKRASGVAICLPAQNEARVRIQQNYETI